MQGRHAILLACLLAVSLTWYLSQSKGSLGPSTAGGAGKLAPGYPNTPGGSDLQAPPSISSLPADSREEAATTQGPVARLKQRRSNERRLTICPREEFRRFVDTSAVTQ